MPTVELRSIENAKELLRYLQHMCIQQNETSPITAIPVKIGNIKNANFKRQNCIVNTSTGFG